MHGSVNDTSHVVVSGSSVTVTFETDGVGSGRGFCVKVALVRTASPTLAPTLAPTGYNTTLPPTPFMPADVVKAVRDKEAEIMDGLFRVNVNDQRPVSDN